MDISVKLNEVSQILTKLSSTNWISLSTGKRASWGLWQGLIHYQKTKRHISTHGQLQEGHL